MQPIKTLIAKIRETISNTPRTPKFFLSLALIIFLLSGVVLFVVRITRSAPEETKTTTTTTTTKPTLPKLPTTATIGSLIQGATSIPGTSSSSSSSNQTNPSFLGGGSQTLPVTTNEIKVPEAGTNLSSSDMILLVGNLKDQSEALGTQIGNTSSALQALSSQAQSLTASQQQALAAATSPLGNQVAQLLSQSQSVTTRIQSLSTLLSNTQFSGNDNPQIIVPSTVTQGGNQPVQSGYRTIGEFLRALLRWAINEILSLFRQLQNILYRLLIVNRQIASINRAIYSIQHPQSVPVSVIIDPQASQLQGTTLVLAGTVLGETPEGLVLAYGSNIDSYQRFIPFVPVTQGDLRTFSLVVPNAYTSDYIYIFDPAHSYRNLHAIVYGPKSVRVIAQSSLFDQYVRSAFGNVRNNTPGNTSDATPEGVSPAIIIDEASSLAGSQATIMGKGYFRNSGFTKLSITYYKKGTPQPILSYPATLTRLTKENEYSFLTVIPSVTDGEDLFAILGVRNDGTTEVLLSPRTFNSLNEGVVDSQESDISTTLESILDVFGISDRITQEKPETKKLWYYLTKEKTPSLAYPTITQCESASVVEFGQKRPCYETDNLFAVVYRDTIVRAFFYPSAGDMQSEVMGNEKDSSDCEQERADFLASNKQGTAGKCEPATDSKGNKGFAYSYYIPPYTVTPGKTASDPISITFRGRITIPEGKESLAQIRYREQAVTQGTYLYKDLSSSLPITQSEEFTVTIDNLKPSTNYTFSIVEPTTLGSLERPVVYDALQITTQVGQLVVTGGVGTISDQSTVNVQMVGTLEKLTSGIVPCGNDIQRDPCTWDHMIGLLDRAFKTIFELIAIFGALAFIYAGYTYVMSGGNPGERKKAHEMLKNIIIGAVIVMSAWLVVATVIKLLGVPDAYVLIDF